MKRILLILALAALGMSAVGYATAQRVPNHEDILTRIIPPDSPFNYASMMLRYMEGDTTLTLDHYFYLYYGFAFDGSYNPRAPLPGEDAILEVFSRTKEPSREDALIIIGAARENMTVDPFNPGNINMMTYAYGILGDTLNEKVNADRFEKILATIRSSGTGLRENSPWHILRFTHANDLIASKGFSINSRQVRTRTVEYVRLDRNPDGIRGFFFDFGLIHMSSFEDEPVRRNSRWMLNDIPL